MNAYVIMHNMIIKNEHGQELDYSFYELMGKPVRVERRKDMIAKFLESSHSICDYAKKKCSNFQKDLMDKW
jgi:hypothetical protein